MNPICKLIWSIGFPSRYILYQLQFVNVCETVTDTDINSLIMCYLICETVTVLHV